MPNGRTSSDATEFQQRKSSPTRPQGQSSHDDNMPFPLDAEPTYQDEGPFVNPRPNPSPSNRFPIHSKFGKSPDSSPSRHTGLLTRYGFEKNNNHDSNSNNNRMEAMQIPQRRDYSGSTRNNTAGKFSVMQAPPAPSSDGICFIFCSLYFVYFLFLFSKEL